MSSPAVQLSFTLRTSPNVRTVHLLGSWDNYKSQLPLSAVKDASAKPGSWKGTFRFQGSHSLKLGSRYWYYYIVDGYHVSHDPAKEFVTEKTTGRKLNVLDVPGGKSSSGAAKPSLDIQTSNLDKTKNLRHSRDVPVGRALSPGKLIHPKPSKPYASRGLREADYDLSPIDDLEERFAGTRLSDRSRNYASSPSDLSDSSASSGTAFSASSPSSASSASSLSGAGGCRCERYGVTRDGRRVQLDCGGKRCGYGDSSSSECASSEEESENESSEEESESESDRRARLRKMAERRPVATQPAVKSRSGGGDERRKPVVVERRRR